MIDSLAVREAFRARLLTLVVATTGTTDLAATSAGFSRASGSFLDDGFAAGMEVVPSGFSTANNAPAVIESVSALSLTITGGRTAQTSTSGRALTVGLPLARQWENTVTPYADRPGVRPYIAEQFPQGAEGLLSFPAAGGTYEQSGIYALTWYGLENKGVAGLYRSIDAVKALFTPGTILSTGANAVRIQSGMRAGQWIPLDNGYTSCQLTIPWRAQSVNTIAA